ncbi:hypothetical protein EYF80_032342 [Liparis tanakae]|uniref:Uncharacterized protein n=1 Tax=Liparis tanakae TaxID=230148 RepID=A0A4Z2GXV1_9TELE|nr:hypothetical protein EYF80_032342 [Liparis tanakae]
MGVSLCRTNEKMTREVAMMPSMEMKTGTTAQGECHSSLMMGMATQPRSQCQQHGTPLTTFFLSPARHGMLHTEGGRDESPAFQRMASIYRETETAKRRYENVTPSCGTSGDTKISSHLLTLSGDTLDLQNLWIEGDSHSN